MHPVVIIDDNKIAVEAIAKATDWEKCGCQVAGCAYDGIAGLRLIQEKHPDIVIIDIQMPGLNGLDVIQKIKSGKENTQFIIISGYGEFEYAQKAIRYGVKDYLLKPVMAEELEEALIHAAEALDQMQEEQSYGPFREDEPADALEASLSDIRSRRETYSPMVARALEYVDRNLGQNLTQADICRTLLVSTGHFSKRFKRETGVGFASYVTMAKMEKARILLRDPKNRVNEVARMLGYGDYTYFFQVFKKQFGCAPSDIKTSGKRKGGEENDGDAGE